MVSSITSLGILNKKIGGMMKKDLEFKEIFCIFYIEQAPTWELLERAGWPYFKAGNGKVFRIPIQSLK